MPNIKSAEKRVKVTKTKTLQNNMVKSQLRTIIRKAKEAMEAKSEDAENKLNDALQMIDRAVTKNILHKNTAARKKSRLTQAFKKHMNNI